MVEAAIIDWRRCHLAVGECRTALERSERAERAARARLHAALAGADTADPVREGSRSPSSASETEAAFPSRPRATPIDPPTAPAARGNPTLSGADDEVTRHAIPGAHLTVYLFGSLRVFVGDRALADLNGARTQWMLRYLLLHRRTAVPRDQLIDLLWPGAGSAPGRRNLHQSVYTLRRALKVAGADRAWITFDHECYCFEGDGMWCDVDAFEEAAERSRRLEVAGDSAGAISAGLVAESLAVGELMADLPYEDWAMPQRRRVQALALEVSTRVGDLLLATDQPKAAYAAAQRVLAREPTDEAAHRRAMSALAMTGQRGLVARQFQFCSEILEREYGFGPSEETVSLYHDLVSRRTVRRSRAER